MADDRDFPSVGCLVRKLGFDTSGIGTAGTVSIGRIPEGAIVLDTVVAVTTAFNAATTNAILVGTLDLADRFLGTSTTGTLAAQVWKGIASTGIGYVVPQGGKQVFVQYRQTGTAATTGSVTVAVTFAQPSKYFR